MDAIRGAIFAMVGSALAMGQTPPPQPEFEVASIRPSAAQAGQVNVGLHIDGAQVHCTYFSLKDYLAMAYAVKQYQIQGPDWLASARFDIAAKLPDGAKGEQIPLMLKALFTDRFHMEIHRETKPLPVYALVVAKGGLKMQECPPDQDAENSEGGPGAVNVSASGGRGGISISLGKGSSFWFGNNALQAKRVPMPGFADTLARFLDRPVLDMTELKGRYDFNLEFTPEDYRGMLIRSAITAGANLPPEALRALEGTSNASLFAALQALGLRMEGRKAPVEVLVVDRSEKMPTEN